MAANPTLLSMPIAENGTKNTIPETQATPGNGLMSQSTGFPAECSLPLGAGGVAPDRADFNGAFNLLGGVAFMAQKGFTFNYDATQDYYKGCIVIDPNDGNRYLCIADMTAGTVAPSADTTGDHWIFYPIGVINKRDVITTSGAYTAPVSGWYLIEVKGGGGGGAGGGANTSHEARGGGGGGEGGTTFAREPLAAGDTVAVIVGAGGTGGAASTSSNVNLAGTNGGDSSATANGNTYTGGGGQANGGSYLGAGGTGTIPGAPGGMGEGFSNVTNRVTAGGSGGGAGGGVIGGSTYSSTQNGTHGGGGGGGGANPSTAPSAAKGGNGGDGYVAFSYFDPTLN